MKFAGYSIALCGFLAATAQAAKPQIQWDPNYDFSSIETFEWATPPQASIEISSPFLHEHLINTIQFELTNRGFREVSENGDVRVTYHMSTETDVRLQSSSVGYGFGNYGMGGWGHYGYGFGGPVYTDTRIVEIERGTLMVDIWDASDNALIWRGRVEDISVSGNPQKMQKNIEKAVKRMAKQTDKLRQQAER